MLSTDHDPDPDADPDLRSLSCSWSLSEVNMLIWGLHDYLDHDPDMTSWYWPDHGVLTLILILILILIWGPDPYDILILILILILLLIMIWGPDPHPDSDPDIFQTLTLTWSLSLSWPETRIPEMPKLSVLSYSQRLYKNSVNLANWQESQLQYQLIYFSIKPTYIVIFTRICN